MANESKPGSDARTNNGAATPPAAPPLDLAVVHTRVMEALKGASADEARRVLSSVATLLGIQRQPGQRQAPAPQQQQQRSGGR